MQNLKELNEQDANVAAAHFQSNVQKFRQIIKDLSRKEALRVLFALTVHPLLDENEVYSLSEKEEKIINLGISLVNSKLIMFEYAANESMKNNENKEENKDVTNSI